VQQVNAIENPNPSVGLIAVLDKRRNELKHAVEKEANLALELALLELVEKDFHYLAHTNDQTSLAFDGALDVFTPYAQNTDTAKQAYLNYRDAVEKLLVANTRLGLTEELGLKGELRRTVHQAEQAINGVQLEINTAISQASSDTKNTLHLFGFAIVILLSALLALIGKSVLTRIKAINQMMESIANGDGDLTVRM
ncbi:methyl-accepting chemotaxis protein, partial [Vibrio fortis]